MNKTAQTELHRKYLIDALPEPLTPASRHLQIFDNYIEGTRMRLRKIRDPYTPSWTRILQQHFLIEDAERPIGKIAEIYLNDGEYAAFSRFQGREIRKNRYFHEIDLMSIAFDIYLGGLWGLNIAKIDFETVEMRDAFEPPTFAIFEITNYPFFDGQNLVEKKFSDVQQEVARLGSLTPPISARADE